MKRFDDTLLQQLEKLRLAVRKSVRGRKEGDRSTSRKGGTADFVSHRDYVPGDDLRSVDWALYARLGELFVRQLSREENLTLHLVIDSSSSMRIGDNSKYELAMHLAAGLGAVAWAESARVSLGGGFQDSLGSLLSAIPESHSKEEGCESVLRTVSRVSRESGLVVVLSDFWEDSLREPLLEASSRGDVVLLHILSPLELSPVLEGRYRLVDSESSEIIDRHVGPTELGVYRERLDAYLESWKNWSRDHELKYLFCPSDADWMAVLVRMLREGGLFR